MQWYGNRTAFNGLPKMLYDIMQPDDESFDTEPMATCEDSFLQLLHGWRMIMSQKAFNTYECIEKEVVNWNPKGV